MALRDDDHNKNKAEEAAVETGAQETSRDEGRQEESSARRRSFYTRSNENDSRQEKKVTSSYNFRKDAPVLSLNSAAGDVAKFVELTKEIQKQHSAAISLNGVLEWTVTPATGKDTQMKLDAAVIAARLKDNGMIFASTVIFVGNTVMPKQAVQVGRDHTVRFTTTANDQYEAIGYKESLDDLIALSNPAFIGQVQHLAASPIFLDKPTDAELERIASAVINQIIYSVNAILTTNEFSIAALDLKNNDLLANIAFHQGDVADDITEMPHRADIVVDLMVAPRDERRGGIVNVLSERESTQLAGLISHVDLYYKGEEEQSNSFFALRKKKAEDFDTRIYGIALVISDLKCVAIPEYLMFSLAQVSALMTEPALIQGLRPLNTKGALRTAEALTYELKGEFEKLPEVLNDDEWAGLVANVVRENSQIVQIQIPRSSINTPLLQLLVDACDETNPNRKEAVDVLIEAADNISGDRFSTIMNTSDLYDVGIIRDMPQLLGTWIDEQGHKRDLREIGYYEILTNFGLKSPQVVADYDRCLNDDSIDLQVRMDQMEKIIEDYTGGQYQITDRADVIEVNANWLFGLTRALSAAGMVVTADGITQDGRTSRRGYTSRYESNGYDGAGFRSRSRSSYGFGGR